MKTEKKEHKKRTRQQNNLAHIMFVLLDNTFLYCRSINILFFI